MRHALPHKTVLVFEHSQHFHDACSDCSKPVWDADARQVHSGFLDILESFQKKEDGTEQLADIVKEITGDWVHTSHAIPILLVNI